MSRLAAWILLALTFVLAALPVPVAFGQGASLPDIEDEVMCTICGTTLQLSNSPQAERQRVFINGLIAEGRDKEQIKSALVDEYGPEVLAVPSDEGFDLVGGWIVPAVGVAAGAVAVGLAALRWRRSQRDDEVSVERDPTAADEKRLQDDLDRYA